eukprot:a515397_7.p1 GENE.a515397_7~~a515397_7.p1  ORF type:complete len:209 (-),score=47.62 a515397_7:5-595(-)
MAQRLLLDMPPEISRAEQLFPLCVVWTILPLVSCLCPCIGHVGIGAWGGRVFDFAGNFFVSEGHFAFGEPLKYWRLDPRRIHVARPHATSSCSSGDSASGDDAAATYDAALAASAVHFRTKRHHMLTQNCHSHVADTLNRLAYDGRTNWNMVRVWWELTLRSRYVSWGPVARVYVPFLVWGSIVVGLAVLLRHAAR